MQYQKLIMCLIVRPLKVKHIELSLSKSNKVFIFKSSLIPNFNKRFVNEWLLSNVTRETKFFFSACSTGAWQCRRATLKEKKTIQPFPSIDALCDGTQGLEYTDCQTKQPKTCQVIEILAFLYNSK
jgi:hypothetical protein